MRSWSPIQVVSYDSLDGDYHPDRTHGQVDEDPDRYRKHRGTGRLTPSRNAPDEVPAAWPRCDHCRRPVWWHSSLPPSGPCRGQDTDVCRMIGNAIQRRQKHGKIVRRVDHVGEACEECGQLMEPYTGRGAPPIVHKACRKVRAARLRRELRRGEREPSRKRKTQPDLPEGTVYRLNEDGRVEATLPDGTRVTLATRAAWAKYIRAHDPYDVNRRVPALPEIDPYTGEPYREEDDLLRPR